MSQGQHFAISPGNAVMTVNIPLLQQMLYSEFQSPLNINEDFSVSYPSFEGLLVLIILLYAFLRR